MGNLLKIQVIRYVDKEGRRVPKGTPDARALKQRSRKWYGQYKDANGKRSRTPLCTDKAAALQMLAKLERDIAQGKEGLVDPYKKHRKAPISEHVDDYTAHLRNNENVSAKHLKETIRRLRYILDNCQVTKLTDIRSDGVELVLRTLAETGANGKSKEGASARTRNTYLGSARAFTRWCFESGRTDTDLLAAITRAHGKKRTHSLAAAGEARRKRRSLTETELVRLLRVARERPLREAMTIRTGNRRGEVAGNVRPEVRERLGHLNTKTHSV